MHMYESIPVQPQQRYAHLIDVLFKTLRQTSAQSYTRGSQRQDDRVYFVTYLWWSWGDSNPCLLYNFI